MEIRRLSPPPSRGITSLPLSLSLSLTTTSFCSSSGELRRSGKERWKTGRWEREERDKMKGCEEKDEKAEEVAHRVSDKIQRARSGSSLLFLLSFLFLFVSLSLTPALSLLSIARVSLLSPLSRHSVPSPRPRPLPHPVHVFFPTRSSGIPPLLTARLPLSRPRTDADPIPGDVLRSSLDSTVNLSKVGIPNVRIIGIAIIGIVQATYL